MSGGNFVSGENLASAPERTELNDISNESSSVNVEVNIL